MTSGSVCNKSVHTLKLCNSRLDGKAVGYLAKALWRNTTLTYVDLRGNELKEEGATHVAELLSINPNIETLVLQNTGIGGEGCMRIADALLGPHGEDEEEEEEEEEEEYRRLTHLDISKCDIHPLASKRIAAALASPHNRALVHLNMSSVYHTQSIGPIGVQTIAAALNVNRTLRSLDISGAEAGAAGIAALALSLRGGNGLGNGLGNGG